MTVTIFIHGYAVVWIITQYFGVMGYRGICKFANSNTLIVDDFGNYRYNRERNCTVTVENHGQLRSLP